MGVYGLLMTIVFLLVVAYVLSNNDIMEPSVLLICGYLIACISCIMNIEKWGVNLQFNTCFLIVLGIVFFIVGDQISKAFVKDKYLRVDEMTQTALISVPNTLIILFSLYNAIVMVLYFKEIISIAGGLLATFNETMNEYRSAYSYSDVQVSSYLVQMVKVSKGSAYAFLYIFVNNIFADNVTSKRKKIVSNLKYLIPTFLFLIQTFLKGGRLNLIMLLVAALFLFYFQWHRKVGWNIKLSSSFIKHLVVIFVIFILIFYYSKELVGRQNNSNIFDYITAYFGGSFQLLDQYMNTSNQSNFGMETFPGILQSLHKLGLYNDYIHKSLEFRSTPTGIYLGNIYTGLRRFYNDFGYLGVIFMQILYGWVFGSVYRKIKKMRYINCKRVFLITAYDTMLFAVVTQAMEDHFWIDLSLGYLIELLVFYVCIKIIFEWRFCKPGYLVHSKWSS